MHESIVFREKYVGRRIVISSTLVWAVFVWLYVIETSSFFIKSNLLDNAIQAGCCLFMIMFIILNRRINVQSFGNILLLYVILIIHAAIQDISVGNIKALRFEFRFLLFTVILVYVCVSLSKMEKIPRCLFTVVTAIGIIITVQCLILLFMNVTGLPIQTKTVFIEKFGNPENMEIHGLGAVKFDGGTIFGITFNRLKSYFVEPSKFAQYLTVPLFFCHGLYLKTKRTKYKIYTILMTICYFFIFSRAGYIGLLGACAITKFYGKKRKVTEELYHDVYKKRAGVMDILKLIAWSMFFLLLAILLLKAMVYLSNFFPTFRILSAGITDNSGRATLVRGETVDINYILNMIKNRPFGYGVSANEVGGSLRWDTNLANGFMYWLAVGGIPGALLLIIIQFVLINDYAISALQSIDPLRVAIAQAYFSLSIQMLSYGTFISVDYMMILGLLIMSSRRRIE